MSSSSSPSCRCWRRLRRSYRPALFLVVVVVVVVVLVVVFVVVVVEFLAADSEHSFIFGVHKIVYFFSRRRFLSLLAPPFTVLELLSY